MVDNNLLSFTSFQQLFVKFKFIDVSLFLTAGRSDL